MKHLKKTLRINFRSFQIVECLVDGRSLTSDRLFLGGIRSTGGILSCRQVFSMLIFTFVEVSMGANLTAAHCLQCLRAYCPEAYWPWTVLGELKNKQTFGMN